MLINIITVMMMMMMMMMVLVKIKKMLKQRCRSHKIYINRSQLSLLLASWYQSSAAAAELSRPAISAKHSVLVGIWHRVLPSNLIVHQTSFLRQKHYVLL